MIWNRHWSWGKFQPVTMEGETRTRGDGVPLNISTRLARSLSPCENILLAWAWSARARMTSRRWYDRVWMMPLTPGRAPTIWLMRVDHKSQCSAFILQSWDISKSREFDRLTDQASPQTIARAASERWIPNSAN